MLSQRFVLSVGDVKMDFDLDTKEGRAAYREDLQERMAAEGLPLIDDFGWRKLWVVLEGEQYDDGIFHGHNVVGLFRKWEDAEKCVPLSYKKDEGSWECDEFVWLNQMDGRCIIIKEHKIS
jgi:hypothetical protein